MTRSTTKTTAKNPADTEKVETANGEVVASFAADRNPIWAHLARPFESDWIEKLPKNLKRGDEKKARCEDTPAGRTVSADGYYCGGWHAKSLHLDYVGHAGITMRLNEDVGPENWGLTPMGRNEQGLPIYNRGEFWVALRILDVVKFDLAESFNTIQEAWGDGLRRAAMRFGIGTDLWSKSDYAFNRRANAEEVAAQPDTTPEAGEHIHALKQRIAGLTDEQKQDLTKWWTSADLPKIDTLSPEQAKVVDGQIDNLDEAQKKALVESRLGAQEVKGEETPNA
jgi:hypothetical protein